jgi:hypothetical protein
VRNVLFAILTLAAFTSPAAPVQTQRALIVRGQSQVLRIYGAPTAAPVVLTSGDGGFVHLAPLVADFLASNGYYVVGVDAKAYLSSFTSGDKTLSPADTPSDYRAFLDAARLGRDVRVPLIGISEGAGLSVLAATDPDLQKSLMGVIALGLPDVNELGWRWRDSVIYITHGVPNEPSFHAGDYVAKLGTMPLAAIHSTHDEFVPVDTLKKVLGPLVPTRRLWLIEAADHRFSDKQPDLQGALVEALEWIRTTSR